MNPSSRWTNRSLATQNAHVRAFTLIEILVVFGIIAILATLLIPAVKGALARADAAKCASNLRQIGVGLISFAGDNDGAFPTAGGEIVHGATDPQTQKAAWTEQLEPYMGGTGLAIYHCASAARLLPEDSIYSYFLGARAAYLKAGGYAPLKIQLISSPSKMILGGENASASFTKNDADRDDYTVNAPFATKGPHNGKSNLLFVDGSVRAYSAFDVNEMQVSYDDPTATY